MFKAIKKPIYAYLVEFYINVQNCAIAGQPVKKLHLVNNGVWCLMNRSHYNQHIWLWLCFSSLWEYGLKVTNPKTNKKNVRVSN